MAQLEPLAKKIQAKGSLVYIAAQTRGGVAAINSDPEIFLQQHPVSYPFLLDEDRRVTHHYGVYVRLNLESINIARPATFVIDAEGTVRFIYVGSTQTDRAEVDAMMVAFEAAAKGRKNR